jgi:hypothetical protein
LFRSCSAADTGLVGPRHRTMFYELYSSSHFPEALNRKARNSYQHLFVGDLTHLVFIRKADSVVARPQNNQRNKRNFELFSFDNSNTITNLEQQSSPVVMCLELSNPGMHGWLLHVYVNIELAVNNLISRTVWSIVVYVCMRHLFKTNGYVGGKNTEREMNFMSLI